MIANATAGGITVCNTPIAPMVSTEEHTLTLMFAMAKHLPQQVARARQGLKAEPVGRTLELGASILGLIGFGRIASRVAVAAHALGMQVIASNPAVAESVVPGVELVDHDALPTAIDNGHLAGAGLDVTDPEPPVGTPAARSTQRRRDPHCTSSSVAGRRRLYEHSINDALSVLAGEPADIVVLTKRERIDHEQSA